MKKDNLTYSSIPYTAKRIGISQAHYYREMKKGNQPKGTKIGGRRIVADQAVDAILQGGDSNE